MEPVLTQGLRPRSGEFPLVPGRGLWVVVRPCLPGLGSSLVTAALMLHCLRDHLGDAVSDPGVQML